MKKKFWIIGGLVLGAVVIVALLFLLPSGGQGRPATVIETINQVDAHPRPKDDWQPAAVGMDIYGGGQVRTGSESAARMKLLEGVVRLSAESFFTVKESTTRQGRLVTALLLESGRLWAHLTTDQPHEFTVETGNAIAAVRDTRFSVRVADGETLLSVAEGQAVLMAQEQSVTVAAGEQTTVKPGQPPAPPEPMSDDERRLWAIEGEMPELAPPTPTPTPTHTPTPTPTPIPTPTFTPSPTPLPTLSPTAKTGIMAYYYAFNTAKPPFDNPLVRQAFALALDRGALAALINARGDYEGATLFPATTFTPPYVLGRDLYGQVGLAYDPDRARELLAQAGYPGGAGLPAITFYVRDWKAHRAVAQATQSQWRDVLGAEVELTLVPLEEYGDVIHADDPQIRLEGWGADYVDPYNFLHDALCLREPIDVESDPYQSLREAIRNETDEEARHALYTEMSRLLCPSWQTQMHWDNAEYTALLDAAFNEPDPEIRRDLYVQAERILCETDAVVIPLYWR